MSQQQTYSSSNPLRAIMGLVFLVVVLYLVFKVVGFVVSLLWYLVPILFIATLIIDHKVVLDFGKWIGQQFKKNAGQGIIIALLSVLFSFLVVPYLFGKAMLKRKVRQMRTNVEEKVKGKYADYEEVPEEEVEFELKDEEEIITLDIPRQPKREQPKRNNYDDLFDDL